MDPIRSWWGSGQIRHGQHFAIMIGRWDLPIPLMLDPLKTKKNNVNNRNTLHELRKVHRANNCGCLSNHNKSSNPYKINA